MQPSDLSLIFTSWLVLYAVTLWQILRKRQEPDSMLLRLFVVTFLPIIGSLFYFLFLFRRRIPRINQYKPVLPGFYSRESNSVARLASQLSGFQPARGNSVDVLLDASQALECICEAIQSATSYVFVEYYIISADRVARRITNELIKAKNRGVRVRVMYDVVGSRTFSGESAFFLRLKRKGLQIVGFLPLRSFFRMFNISLRNHRKLLIVDGRVAFSGGTNIGIEYFGRWHRQQQYDYTFRFRGPICQQLETVFASDWSFVAGQDVSDLIEKGASAPTMPESSLSEPNVDIQILPGGPDTMIPVFYSVLMQLLYESQESVCCVTPYFIPSHGFKIALMNAAARGVRVRLILPSKIDWMPVLYASRSYWDELVRAGVEIYEFPRVLLHAKLMVVDQKWVLLGSSNLDTRSFCLNYELDFLVRNEAKARLAQDLFEREIQKSRRLDAVSFLRRGQLRRCVENACRLFSPML